MPEQTELERSAEEDRVVVWRLHQLLKAGYSVQTGERLAARTDVDLHRALELVEQGCRHEVAALILL